jgi:putative oxidoreductase
MMNQLGGRSEALRAWAPLPLRLALGVGLIQHGGIKLFAPGGHANIAHLVQSSACPRPT